ncbi:MAG: ATP-binding cassette domain-containing protein [Rubrivivax sp.]
MRRGERIAILRLGLGQEHRLLRCLNFMEWPSAGHIILAGAVVGRQLAAAAGASPDMRRYSESEVVAVRQRVGMVFQQFNLFPHMTLGNVMEGLRTVKRLLLAAARASARWAVPRAWAWPTRPRHGRRVSRAARKQRVAIARALAMDPEVLLFDEPTSAPRPRAGGRGAARHPCVAEGRTMLLVTHEIGFAYHFADRVLFLADGVIHEEGLPEQVLKAPARPRTQAFWRAIASSGFSEDATCEPGRDLP